MRWSQTLIPTSRDDPPDAEAASHRLLLRGGFIHRVAPGIYAWLPLGLRVRHRIAALVRREMACLDAAEMSWPIVQPASAPTTLGEVEPPDDTRLAATDRQGRHYILGGPDEGLAAQTLAAHLDSHRRLPLTVFQLRTMFMDVARPRAALLRTRERTVHEAFSFHASLEGPGGLTEAGASMHHAYARIFAACRLSPELAEAPSGAGVDSPSLAFMCASRHGEDAYFLSEDGYAATADCCPTGLRPHSFAGEASAPLERLYTPRCASIDDVCRFLSEHTGSPLKPRRLLKTLLYEVQDSRSAASRRAAQLVLAVVRGDHELCEAKLQAAVRRTHPAADHVRLATPQVLASYHLDFPIGFLGPHFAKRGPCKTVIVDYDAARGDEGWITGANQINYHVRHFNWSRDLLNGAPEGDAPRLLAADIRLARPNDPAPEGRHGRLRQVHAIETARIELLGSRYCHAVGFTVHDEHQQQRPVQMARSRLVLDRLIAAIVEQHRDQDGIIWPPAVAPCDVIVLPVKYQGPVKNAADRIAAELEDAGFDVLLDDRDERPGVKFKDADLIGIPVRITVGDRTLAQDGAELRCRNGSLGRGELVALDELVECCRGSLEEMHAS